MPLYEAIRNGQVVLTEQHETFDDGDHDDQLDGFHTEWRRPNGTIGGRIALAPEDDEALLREIKRADTEKAGHRPSRSATMRNRLGY